MIAVGPSHSAAHARCRALVLMQVAVGSGAHVMAIESFVATQNGITGRAALPQRAGKGSTVAIAVPKMERGKARAAMIVKHPAGDPGGAGIGGYRSCPAG